MASHFYNTDIPFPFGGILEEESEIPGKKHRRVIFTGGLPGSMGFSGGSFPFVMDLAEDGDEEDPNP